MNLPRVALAALLVGQAQASFATNGYFSHGHGARAKGMAGAATALAGDAYAGANNPGGLAFVDDRLEIGVDIVYASRSVQREGGGEALDGSVRSKRDFFGLNELALVRRLSDTLSAGVTLYANGGGNTHYPGGQLQAASAPGCSDFNTAPGPYNLFCGNGPLGIDLAQIIVAPTLAWRLHPQHAIGVAPLIGVQRFRLLGRQSLDNPVLTLDPGNVTNRGRDTSFGIGVRVGYQGEIAPGLRVGAAYAPRMRFEKFEDYSGLLDDGGRADIPANYNLGVAWQASPALLLALDYQRIEYGDTESVANPSANNLNCFPGGIRSFCSGGANAPGLGWRSIDVWKLGVEYRVSPSLVVRGGVSRNQNPVPVSDVSINFIAPAISENHVTLGATWTRANGDEASLHYAYAVRNRLTGPSGFNSVYPGLAATDSFESSLHVLGVSYNWKGR